MPHIEIHGHSEKELRKVKDLINAFIDNQKGTVAGVRITLGIYKNERCKYGKSEVFLRVYLEELIYHTSFNYLMDKLGAFEIEIQLIKFRRIPF